MLYTIGFPARVPVSRITGIILASPPLDFAVSDSYFVGGARPLRAGGHRAVECSPLYFWWPQ